MSVNAKKSISSLYEREEKQKKQSNWKTQYKGLMSSYHEKLSQEDNKGEKQFDDNGKTYHIANKMKLIY